MTDTPILEEERELEEPIIDWLIDQLCPESSPLIDFNKKRLKQLFGKAKVEELERIHIDWDSKLYLHCPPIPEGENSVQMIPIPDRIAHIKKEYKLDEN